MSILMNSILSEDLLESVCEIAQRAGLEILEVYASANFEVEYKSDDSPLTLADRKSHECILAGLNDLAVQFPVLSEEAENIDYAIRKDWETFWLVDPLDGTKEFLKKNGEFTVNIALIHQGKPILGVVFAPAKKLFYRAMVGHGADMKSKTGWLKIATSKINKNDLRIVSSRSHPSPKLTEYLESLESYELVEIGSSLKICYVAEGQADFYPRLGPTMEWDTAAAHCVLNEANGALLDMNGIEFIYNRENLLNSNFVATSESAQKSGILSKIFEIAKS